MSVDCPVSRLLIYLIFGLWFQTEERERVGDASFEFSCFVPELDFCKCSGGLWEGSILRTQRKGEVVSLLHSSSPKGSLLPRTTKTLLLTYFGGTLCFFFLNCWCWLGSLLCWTGFGGEGSDYVLYPCRYCCWCQAVTQTVTFDVWNLMYSWVLSKGTDSVKEKVSERYTIGNERRTTRKRASGMVNHIVVVGRCRNKRKERR